MWCAAHVQHLWKLWRRCSVVLKEDVGTGGLPPMYFSMPASPPSISLWCIMETRVGEPDLEHDKAVASQSTTVVR